MKRILLFWLYCSIPFWCLSHSKTDSVIFCALDTELGRAMEKLSIEKLEKPFFISLIVQDAQAEVLQSSFGSTVQKIGYRLRSVSPRVLVGNYDRTQELFQYNQPIQEGTIIEDNCLGIRHSLWLTLDAAYKKAAEQYAQKISYINTKNIAAEELALPDFSKEKKIVKQLQPEEFNIDLSLWERQINNLSGLAKQYPGIATAAVQLQHLKTNYYFVNSEETKYILPLSLILLIVEGSIILPSGEIIEHNITLTEPSFTQLPSIDSLTQQVHRLFSMLSNSVNIPKIEESYSGPVILEGEALRSVLLGKLFSSNESLIGYRSNIEQTDAKTWLEKRNRKVITNDVSVYDIPSLSFYGEKQLLGYTPIDAEGVVPKDTTILIEKGLLRNFLNDRIPNKAGLNSTGNRKFSVSIMSSYSLISPNVIMIEAQKSYQASILKEKLRAAAKNEGLTYAYIVKEMSGNNPLLLHRIDVETGNETIYRGAELSNINTSTLKRIMAVSSQQNVENILFRNVPTSIIYPDAMLFDEVDLDKDRKTSYEKPPTVSNPGMVTHTPVKEKRKSKK